MLGILNHLGYQITVTRGLATPVEPLGTMGPELYYLGRRSSVRERPDGSSFALNQLTKELGQSDHWRHCAANTFFSYKIFSSKIGKVPYIDYNVSFFRIIRQYNAPIIKQIFKSQRHTLTTVVRMRNWQSNSTHGAGSEVPGGGVVGPKIDRHIIL